MRTLPAPRVRERQGSAQGARGFSLVELLVAIGVFGLLLGVLLPALAMARSSAGAAGSLANLHNLGITLHLYGQRNNGYAPFFKPGEDCLFGGPPDELDRDPEKCVRVSLVWSIEWLWPMLMHDVAPWPEHFETWLSPGHRRKPPYWPVPVGIGLRFVSYDYSRSFVAAPRVWSDEGQVDESDIQPTLWDKAQRPSRKVVMYDAERNYLRSRVSSPRPLLFVDGTAALRKDSEATKPVVNRLFRVGRPRIYHDTPNGVRGWDF